MRPGAATALAAALAFALLGGAALAQGATPLIPAGAPDLIVYNAKVVTVDATFSIAQAFAVKDGRFVSVGADAAVLKTAGPSTRKLDLKGQTVLPGFNDTHNHLSKIGSLYNVMVDLSGATSIADIQNRLKVRLATSKSGAWILGSRGWWEYALKDGRLPTRDDLDKIAPDNPVAIAGPHYVIVNTLALKLGGISRDTPNPQGGEIYKDKAGEPNGLLMDTASGPVARLYPKASHDQEIAGMKTIMAQENSEGLTSIGDPTGGPTDVARYRELYDQGLLSLRVDFAYTADPNAPLAETEALLKSYGLPGQAWGDGMFRSDELGEVLVDGAELSALLREDYPDRPGFRGLPRSTKEQYAAFASLANRMGWRLRPHAVGDAAIDQVLYAYEVANREKPLIWRRWMIDHAFLLKEDHIPKVRALGVIINSQYMHNAQLGLLTLRAWRKPLADQSEPYKLWVDNGVMFAGGSDGPVHYYARPLYEIYGEVTRKTMWGGSLGPDQGISLQAAIKSVTINGAYTSFEENVKGSIEAGKYADFVVLSGDILTVPVDTIKDLKVKATVLGGRTVFGQIEAQ